MNTINFFVLENIWIARSVGQWKQHTVIVNANYFSKFPLVYNEFFHSNRKMWLIVIIEYEVFESLILKEMENHPNLCELWDHLLEK